MAGHGLSENSVLLKKSGFKNIFTETGKHHLHVKKNREDLLMAPMELHVKFSIEFLFSARTRFHAKLIGIA
jgi:hypothetical protein